MIELRKLFIFILLLICQTYLVGVAGSEKTATSSRRHYDLSRQMSLLRAATTTRIDDELSPGNITAIRGETALLVCTVINIGDKSLSWLRHSLPIPQLLGLNNITNTLNPRYKAVVSGGWSEFVLVIKDVRPRDSGTYECQISGPKHSSLKKLISLTVIESLTEVVGGPDIHVDRQSTLQMTCRVSSGDNTPAYIIWMRDSKILKFDGGETSSVPYLTRDNRGRHLSVLTIDNIELSDSGEYSCQPAAGPKATVMLHVLQRETEVQAVLGEGGEDSGPAVTLPAISASKARSCCYSMLPAYFLSVILLFKRQ